MIFFLKIINKLWGRVIFTSTPSTSSIILFGALKPHPHPHPVVGFVQQPQPHPHPHPHPFQHFEPHPHPYSHPVMFFWPHPHLHPRHNISKYVEFNFSFYLNPQKGELFFSTNSFIIYLVPIIVYSSYKCLNFRCTLVLQRRSRNKITGETVEIRPKNGKNRRVESPQLSEVTPVSGVKVSKLRTVHLFLQLLLKDYLSKLCS